MVLYYLGTGGQMKALPLYLAWSVIIAVLTATGFFQDTASMPPRMLLVMLPAIAFVIYTYRQIDVNRLNPRYLLAIHILRLPIELVLYQLYLKGEVPIIMTFAGWNFDIVIGISAAVLLLLRKDPRLWHIFGLVLLTIIVLTAILSAPSPVQLLAKDRPNVALLEFPYTLLPALIVPLVLLSHLLSLKRMNTHL